MHRLTRPWWRRKDRRVEQYSRPLGCRLWEGAELELCQASGATLAIMITLVDVRSLSSLRNETDLGPSSYQVQGRGLGCHCIFSLALSGREMRKQRLNIWLVCAAAGLEGSSNAAPTSFRILSIGGTAQEHRESGRPAESVLQARGLLRWELQVGEDFAGGGGGCVEARRGEMA